MVARGLARGADYLWTQHITTSIHENEIFASAGGFLATEKIDISFHGSSEFGTAVTAAAHATLAMQAIPRHSEGASRICVGSSRPTRRRHGCASKCAAPFRRWRTSCRRA